MTITANNATKVYGAALPALSATYAGFVNGDTSASLTTQPTLSTTATAASPVGSYSVTASGAVDANYTISYVGGSLTVTPAALTITANNATKVYGAALPTLSASYAGFVNGDTSASLTTQPTLSTRATTASPVGSYTVMPWGTVDANYTISYIGGTLTVTAATLTVTANDASLPYGTANPTFSYTITGYVNGDNSSAVSGTASVSTTATTNSNIGTYPLTPTAGSLNAANYGFAFVNGTLTVTAADSLTTVTATPNPVIETNPETLTATVSAATGTGIPVGTVQFQIDGVNLGTPVTLVGGVASLVTTTLTQGTHTVTALYVNTDGNFTDSTGTFSGLVVNSNRPSFTILDGVDSSNRGVRCYPITFQVYARWRRSGLLITTFSTGTATAALSKLRPRAWAIPW